MKIETRGDQAFFEIRPGERVFVSFGSTEVEIGTTPDIMSGEMTIAVMVPGDYTRSRLDLGKGAYETRFVVTGGPRRGPSREGRKRWWYHFRRWLCGLSKWTDKRRSPEGA